MSEEISNRITLKYNFLKSFSHSEILIKISPLPFNYRQILSLMKSCNPECVYLVAKPVFTSIFMRKKILDS